MQKSFYAKRLYAKDAVENERNEEISDLKHQINTKTSIIANNQEKINKHVKTINRLNTTIEGLNDN